MIDNLTNFANMFKDVSFLDDSISMCVTHVEDHMTHEQVVCNIKGVFESPYLKGKAEQLLTFCLKNVQLSFKPKIEHVG